MGRKILVVMPADEGHREILKAAAPEAEFVYTSFGDVTKEMTRDANVIIGNVNPAWLKDCENLELMQLNSAGTDGYTQEGIVPEKTVLCNATGGYGTAISEHMIACAFALLKRIPGYLESQKNHVWEDLGNVGGFIGATVVSVGMGDIGSEFLKRAKALGSHTIGIVRTPREELPDFADEVYTSDRLKEAVAEADIVAASLPGTALTAKMFDRDFFSCMKKSAIFLNVGRGTAVDTEALCEALQEGRIAGASVDVTDPEPLPADHPLWDAPNLILTPHISGGHHMKITWDKIIGIAAENVRQLEGGRAFVSVVDRKTGYRKK